VLAVLLTNCYSPSPRHRLSVFLDRLNEPCDDFDILINIAAHRNQRPIQHCYGCKLNGPRIVHVNGHMELPHLRPPALNKLPRSSNLTFLKTATIIGWLCGNGIVNRRPKRHNTGDMSGAYNLWISRVGISNNDNVFVELIAGASATFDS
jgi:hypothetical protein